jgi:hypothetical protein
MAQAAPLATAAPVVPVLAPVAVTGVTEVPTGANVTSANVAPASNKSAPTGKMVWAFGLIVLIGSTVVTSKLRRNRDEALLMGHTIPDDMLVTFANSDEDVLV